MFGPVGDDFVDVHVELRAASGHPYGQGEIAIEFAGQNVIAGLDNGIGPVAVDDAQFFVGQSSSFFQVSKDGDHFGGNLFRANLKILETALCLGAQSLSAGTLISPIESLSIRYSMKTSHIIKLYKT